jgi:hypothetical protein
VSFALFQTFAGATPSLDPKITNLARSLKFGAPRESDLALAHIFASFYPTASEGS